MPTARLALALLMAVGCAREAGDIRSANDLERLGRRKTIDEDVRIQVPGAPIVDLGQLEKIDGDLWIAIQPATERIVFPKLESIAGDLILIGADRTGPVRIEAPLLRSIGRDLGLELLRAVDLELGALAAVERVFWMHLVHGRVSLPALLRLGGSLEIEDVSDLALSLPALEQSGPVRGIRILSSTIDLGGLRAVEAFDVERSNQPDDPGDARRIDLHADLTDVDLHSLMSISGLNVRGDLGRLDLSGLEAVEVLSLSDGGAERPQGGVIDLSSLKVSGEVRVAMPAHRVVGRIESANTLILEVGSIDLRGLRRADAIDVTTTGAVELDLERLSSITLIGASSFSAPRLIEGGVFNLNGVTTLDLPALAKIGYLGINYSPSERLDFPALAELGVSCGGIALSVSANPNLATLGFPALATVHGSIGLRDNGALDGCALLAQLAPLHSCESELSALVCP
jgi:hypothetical protein